jgi:hypothetical protein
LQKDICGAKRPTQASPPSGQKSLERRHDTLPEHPDRIARFRAAMAQNAIDQAGHGLGRGLSGFVLVLLALEFVERRAIGAVLWVVGQFE